MLAMCSHPLRRTHMHLVACRPIGTGMESEIHMESELDIERSVMMANEDTINDNCKHDARWGERDKNKCHAQ